MSKELLKITHVNEGACEAELDCSNTYEKELTRINQIAIQQGKNKVQN